MSHTFRYLDLNDIEGGWGELYRDIPDWISEIRKETYAPLEKDAELAMIKIAKTGVGGIKSKAKDEVIRRNLRFVVNIARHYLHNELDTADLISTGNEALVIAFEKFDPERNVKFITYAVNLIRAYMIELLRDTSAIKLSAPAIQLINDYILLGDIRLVKETFPDRYVESIEKLELKIDKFLNIRYMSSLDTKFNSGDSRSDTMATPITGEEFTFGDEIKDIIYGFGLEEVEAKVIVLNFGLEEDIPALGLREIATRLDSNLSAIAKIRNKALYKLKADDRLKDILDEINEDDEGDITWAHPTVYRSLD